MTYLVIDAFLLRGIIFEFSRLCPIHIGLCKATRLHMHRERKRAHRVKRACCSVMVCCGILAWQEASG